jgi:hypothetical protein
MNIRNPNSISHVPWPVAEHVIGAGGTLCGVQVPRPFPHTPRITCSVLQAFQAVPYRTQTRRAALTSTVWSRKLYANRRTEMTRRQEIGEWAK